MLMTFEGWQLKVEIQDNSEKIRSIAPTGFGGCVFRLTPKVSAAQAMAESANRPSQL